MIGIIKFIIAIGCLMVGVVINVWTFIVLCSYLKNMENIMLFKVKSTISKNLLMLLMQMFVVLLFLSICTVTGFILSYLIDWHISLGERMEFHYLELCCANGFAIIAFIFIVCVWFPSDETKK